MLLASSANAIGGWDAVLRLAVATSLGAAVGIERELREREAGIRTHLLVSLGACLFTIVGAYGFHGFGSNVDPTRVAAQIVTGIGFLGAGAIIREGISVRGLTTAASIWLVAAVGMLVGSGLYLLAVFTTVLGFATLRWGRPPSRRRRLKSGEPSITGEPVIADEEEQIVD